jgi:rhodanese-related sulfurtransferase
MDTTKPPVFSCSPAELFVLLSSTEAPLLVDVRKTEACEGSAYTLPGALRRNASQTALWATMLPSARQVVVACVHGREVSQGVMSVLRSHGINASFLQGGVEGWREQGYPVTTKDVTGLDEKHDGTPR